MFFLFHINLIFSEDVYTLSFILSFLYNLRTMVSYIFPFVFLELVSKHSSVNFYTCMSSDSWGGCKFCCLCICSSYSCDSAGSIKHHFQVWQVLHYCKVLIAASVGNIMIMWIPMQCSVSSFHFGWKLTYVWCGWLYSLFGWFCHHCFACPTGARYWVCQTSMALCNWAR